ncbi:hypothetical protein BH09PSE4_BH09PSE4_16040 [soil metagenome]
MVIAVWPNGQEKRYRYRVAVCGEGRSPWRDSRDRAMVDAVELELASRDEELQEWFLAVPVEIEVGVCPQTVTPTRSTPRPWSQEDVAALRRLAPGFDWASDIGRKIGRSEAAVIAKARQLRIELRSADRDDRQIRAVVAEIERSAPKQRRGRR